MKKVFKKTILVVTLLFLIVFLFIGTVLAMGWAKKFNPDGPSSVSQDGLPYDLWRILDGYTMPNVFKIGSQQHLIIGGENGE
jgi:hypothetical protein